MKRRRSLIGLMVGGMLLWASLCRGAVSPQTEPGGQDSAILAATNWEALSGAYLHLQQQVHEAKLALEANRQEAERIAARNADLMAAQLRAIEQSLAAQRASQLEEIQKSNRLLLMLAGLFAGIGLLTLLGMAYFQWHTLSRLAELSTIISPAAALSPGRTFPRLIAGGTVVASADAADEANGRWTTALAQLEQRIGELEHATRPSLETAATTDTEASPPLSGDSPVSTPKTAGSHSPESGRVKALLGKSQALLNRGRPADALKCLQQASSLEPDNLEVLVKQGTALEQLGKLDEAVACYDRAIAADGSMTIAYLCKGGLFNRTQRFQEALECYELALHTKTKPNP